MNQGLYLALDGLTGAIISVMVVANTALGHATTMGVSLLVNHVIGLGLVSLILFFGRKRPAIVGPKQKAPLPLYFSGMLGVIILNFNFFSFTALGASLAMALTVFGQSVTSLVFDLNGWLGMEKRSFSLKKVISLAISGVGIAVMATMGVGSYSPLYILMAFAAGAITITQMILNSTFAIYKGPMRASFQTYIAGLTAAIPFYFLTQAKATLEGFTILPTVPFIQIIAGGVLSVTVLISTAFVIVKLPAIYSALLLSASQILASVAIDVIFLGVFSPALFIGALLMLLGMGGNLLADRKDTAISD
mgnify:CR=1 FL=1